MQTTLDRTVRASTADQVHEDDVSATTRARASFGAVVRGVSALVVGLAAVECLVEAHTGPVPALERADGMFWRLGVPTGPGVGAGAALLLVAVALRGGRRAGWWLLAGVVSLTSAAAAAVLVVSAPGRAVTDVPDVLVPLLWLALLCTVRPSFGAAAAPGAGRRAARIVTIGGAAVGYAGWLLAGAVPGVPSEAGPRLAWVLDALTGGVFDLVPAAPAGGPLRVVLGVAGGGLLIGALMTLLRPAPAPERASAEDEVRLRALIAAHGREDSLAWFATRRDKRVVFAPDGRAAVAFRVVAGTSIASGDPVGRVDSWPGAVTTWLDEVRRHGWQPVVLAAGERGAAVYRRHGLRVRRFGDEVVVDTARLLCTGGQDGRVRRAVERLSARGYRVTVRRVRDVPAADLASIADRARSWRAGAAERGFAMASGRVADPADLDGMVVEAAAPDGRACGLLTFAPWGRDGLSLDVMLRSPQSPPGVVEFMIGEVAAQGAARGVRRLSLNFVTFRRTLEDGARLGAGPLERARRRLALAVSSYAQIASLHRFSLTFEPQWTPRLLCWSGSAARAAVAAGLAEGFLATPSARDATADDAARARGAAFVRLVRALHPDASGDAAPDARGPGHHPALVRQVADIDDVLALHLQHAGVAPDTRTGRSVTVVGRVQSRRNLGAVAFAALRSGPAGIQVIVEASTAGAEGLAGWKAGVATGDLVVVAGELVTSRSGELSVLAAGWQLAGRPTASPARDPLGGAVEQMLQPAGYTQVPLPPLHPGEGTGHGPGPDGAAERLYHLGEDGSRLVLHVRQTLADAEAMLGLLERIAAALPSGRGDATDLAIGRLPADGVERDLPASLLPLARPRDEDPQVADAWRIVIDGREVAHAATALTDPRALRAVLGAGHAAVTVAARGMLPFATLRVDLTALAAAGPCPTAPRRRDRQRDLRSDRQKETS